MTLGLVKLLVKCGALPPKQPGPADPMSVEEAKQRKYEQQRAAVKRRKELIQAAREKGEPDPVFKKGRPCKYTSEEARAMRAAQNSGSAPSYNERVRQGLKNLEAMYGTHNA